MRFKLLMWAEMAVPSIKVLHPPHSSPGLRRAVFCLKERDHDAVRRVEESDFGATNDGGALRPRLELPTGVV